MQFFKNITSNSKEEIPTVTGIRGKDGKLKKIISPSSLTFEFYEYRRIFPNSILVIVFISSIVFIVGLSKLSKLFNLEEELKFMTTIAALLGLVGIMFSILLLLGNMLLNLYTKYISPHRIIYHLATGHFQSKKIFFHINDIQEMKFFNLRLTTHSHATNGVAYMQIKLPNKILKIIPKRDMNVKQLESFFTQSKSSLFQKKSDV